MSQDRLSLRQSDSLLMPARSNFGVCSYRFFVFLVNALHHIPSHLFQVHHVLSSPQSLVRLLQVRQD